MIELIEHQTKIFSKEAIPEAIAKNLWQNYSQYIEIEEPCLRNNQCWKLNAKNYIGIIPVTSDFIIRILPKTSIHSIWKMLDWVDDLRSLKIFDQLTDCDHIEDLCERLARILAKKILNRSKQGLFSTYIPETSRLNVIRGRIDWNDSVRSPWDTRLSCHYSRHTVDIIDNQILLWTLHQIGRIQLLFDLHTQTLLRTTYRALNGTISLQSFAAKNCRDRHYHRLNEDYKIMHILCGFFLENLHSSHQIGQHQALPFLVNTAVLYEKFVYAWLKANLPKTYYLKAQEHYLFNDNINYYIDLVIYNSNTQKAIAVLDTKYKTPDKPSNNDINQILAYAHFKQVKQAILIYPEKLQYHLGEVIHNVHIKTLNFSLDESPDKTGKTFLDSLFPL